MRRPASSLLLLGVVLLAGCRGSNPPKPSEKASTTSQPGHVSFSQLQLTEWPRAEPTPQPPTPAPEPNLSPSTRHTRPESHALKPSAQVTAASKRVAPIQANLDFAAPLDMEPRPVQADPSVRIDYDIVYVRAPRRGDDEHVHWAEIANPALMEPGADLVLLHPNGTEEVLVLGGQGAVTDPYVSFDAQWVYYAYVPSFEGANMYQAPRGGADIYKIHVPSRRIVKLTNQQFTPNEGAADWSSDYRSPEPGKTWLSYGVLNLGPCPLPGGKVMFVSNRNAFKPPKHSSPTLQLFTMDDDGSNVEMIGFLNIAMALHPTILKDGRVLFSSLESQGLRNPILWGIWSIHPDGTGWAPVVSAFDPGEAPNAFHFQTQLSDGNLVIEEYYNLNNSGFGAYLKMPPEPAAGAAPFGPAFRGDNRNPPLRVGRMADGKPAYYKLPFSPFGVEAITRFSRVDDGPAGLARLGDQSAPRVGKFTHPSGAPDNHLLTVWSPGPVNRQDGLQKPAIDGGIYLLKSGEAIDEPGQLLLIKNDPRYNEQWPRALVPYSRIYGVREPARLPALANDGRLSKHLPEGTPFGLIGTSSFYKRESYPNGIVPPGSVTATWPGPRGWNEPYRGLDPFNTASNNASLNWFNQGSDAGHYTNDEIHAVRILVMEPTTDRDQGSRPGRLFRSHATERLRILGEIPLRKFDSGKQPVDPDGNPDTSFLAKIPADVAFTFQTLDKDGMVLNMAQTWHQLRPGEIRHDCGGCHAHSQQPTEFALTAAAKPDYRIFDLTKQTPLLTTRESDESRKKWDEREQSGLRFDKTVKNVEYHRDIKPILDRSCAACHTEKRGSAAGNLVLDDESLIDGVPGTYYRLALDHGNGGARFGHKPVLGIGTWRQTNASRYIRMFQSRRSLLVWKILGRRTDGWTNDDFPTETTPGDPTTLQQRGKPVANTPENRNLADLDFAGSPMPPPDAVARHQVAPLTAEDRLTIVRWIDLGCPIDLDFDRSRPRRHGLGWMGDDNRPTLTLTYPRAGENEILPRILIGMHDYYSGLDSSSLVVGADFAVNGVPPGRNLAGNFKEVNQGVWELKLDSPIHEMQRGTILVSVKDRQGNATVIERRFSVGRGVASRER